MTNTTNCRVCEHDSVVSLVDFKTQPISNRYEVVDADPPAQFKLEFGQCGKCGQFQLIDPVPYQELKAGFDWITYNEPEKHLDDLVSKLVTLPGLEKNSNILALTYKDDTTLNRLNNLGFYNVNRVNPKEDLGIDDPLASLETIQAQVNENTIKPIQDRYGLADLLIVRHVLEHAYDPKKFLHCLSRIVKPDGHIIFEVPDCSGFIKNGDFPFIWEEHIVYFDLRSFKRFLIYSGMKESKLISYEYPFENSLISIVKNNLEIENVVVGHSDIDDVIGEGREFAQSFSIKYEQVSQYFREQRRNGKKIALFGAGHLATRFINFFDLGNCIHGVIDDMPQKQNLYMPGSHVPIISSDSLHDIDICLLALSPESEEKVRFKYQWFSEKGGEFYSIFAASNKSIYDAT